MYQCFWYVFKALLIKYEIIGAKMNQIVKHLITIYRKRGQYKPPHLPYPER